MPGTDRTIFPEKVDRGDGTEQNGLLAPVANPLGKALNTGLSPIGAGVGKVTGPLAEGASNVSKPITDKLGLEDRGEAAEKEEAKRQTVGGGEAGQGNPLGLNEKTDFSAKGGEGKKEGGGGGGGHFF